MQDNALYAIGGVFPYLPARITALLQKLPSEQLTEVTELRLRANLPLLLVTATENLFVTENGRATALWRNGLVTVKPPEIEETVAKACGYSAHSHQTDFKNGYLSLPGGHRIGLCGTAVSDGDNVTGIRDLTALNIRIAKPMLNAANEVLNTCFQSGLQNVLLVGPPMSGKTTILRALAHSLSSGRVQKVYKCAVVDERGELFPNNANAQSPCFADVLSGYKKADGISLAVRSLSPDMIFCDEIGGAQDVLAVTDGMRCGVHFAVTAHADSIDKLFRRAYLKPLFRSGGIDVVVLLGVEEQIGQIKRIYKVGETDVETDGTVARSGVLYADRILSVSASA